MNGLIISRLILKDWRLNRLLLSLAMAIGIGALVLVRYGGQTTRLFGAVWFFVALIVLGSILPGTAILNERKKQTLAFMMSLPVSSLQYSIAKVVSIWAMFVTPWLVLLISAVVVVETGNSIPHGVVPMLLILATLPLLGFCIISSVTLVGESEAWLMAANLGCNSSYWFVWYLLIRIPSLSDNWTAPVAIWNSTAQMFLFSEFAVIAAILALTLFFQSRKRDFV